MASSFRRHAFTAEIDKILSKHFGTNSADIFALSPLLQYLNHKTKSANQGAKARGAFATHYALFVLVEDYINQGYFPGDHRAGGYDKYDGARYSTLSSRQRQLPFGQKLQNHTLNSRLNEEFKKLFPLEDKQPIVRDVASQRYWIQEDLLVVTITDKNGVKQTINIAKAVMEVINAYVATKKEAFESFIESCRDIAKLTGADAHKALPFIQAQLKPEVDARIFEVVSFAVLKAFYGEQQLFWGWSRDSLRVENLSLFKTGRTNANDGGIDFVMKPLGRFFQVTETVDVSKYFLDIDKIQRFPLTFVVKSSDTAQSIKAAIEAQAKAKYKIVAVVDSYMSAIEEIINIPQLLTCLKTVVDSGKLKAVMDEIVLQSQVEFNYQDQVAITSDDDDSDDDDADLFEILGGDDDLEG